MEKSISTFFEAKLSLFDRIINYLGYIYRYKLRGPILEIIFNVRNKYYDNKPVEIKVHKKYKRVLFHPKSTVSKEYWVRRRFENKEILWVLDRFNANNAEGIFFDIGAHHGLFSIIVAKNFPKVKVFSFEPTKNSITILEENIKLNNLENVEIINKAVSSKKGDVDFHVGSDKFSAFNTIGRNKHPRLKEEKTTLIPIQAVSLNSFCEERNLFPDIIKIDAEGAEFLIFKGASDLFDENEKDIHIIFENPYPLIELFDFSALEFVNLLESYGLNLKTLDKHRITFIATNSKKCFHKE